MKSFIAIAGLLLTVTAMCQDLSPVFNLPQCPKSCIMETAGRAKEFGCSSGDIACLCRSKDYQRELMNCAKTCKPEEIDAMTVAGREICDSAGAPAPPNTAADITIPIPSMEIPSLPLPELPSISLPPLPELPSISVPPLPELPSVTVPPLPELPSVPPLPPLPSVPGVPPNAGAQGTASSNPPIGSSGVTYLDPKITPSAAASSSSIEPFLGAANLLSPVHTGAIYFALLTLIL
ncbi:hypothetical protein AJ78_02268 [Emergomyces pasteurianus Ep9510]|uniref:CFEM domain-containing protein n=1 Tax=Emergomyces pasteurianus Ep9510 TaxID=1447872 RepID=A0A1J9QQY6_9EURO|nr:hypothetical protein AJ78_02268 [Emergomyces pasteurianus Ep9510]